MNHSRALARGHRRAASCYNLDFDSIDVEKKQNLDQTKTSGPSSCQSLENFDFFEFFAKPKYDSGEEKSVILDAIESSTDQKQRKELGLKFSSINRVLKECEKSPRQQGRGSARLAECCESPKSAQSRERLQKIQVKYVADLQRIDEDLHEFSLANSRNSLNLKNSAQKALARIVRASGSGRKVLGEIPVCSNLILEEFELEKTKDGIETDICENKNLSNYHKKQRIAVEERNLNGELSKVIVSKSTKSVNLQNSNPSCHTEIIHGENPYQKDIEFDSISSLQKSSSALLDSNLGKESNKTPRNPKMNYFMNSNFHKGAKEATHHDASGPNNQSCDSSSQVLDKSSKFLARQKEEAAGKSCLKTTLQRLYNERNRKSNNNPGIKNIINLNLTKQMAQNNSRDRTTSRPHTPTIAKTDSRVTTINLNQRGSDNSSSRSALRHTKRRMPSEICLEKLKENCPDEKQKRRSASISLKQSNNPLPKSTSVSSGVKKQLQVSEVQDCSVIELKKIISTQQATLSHLKTKVQLLETENKSIHNRYFKLKQENKRLQQDLSTALMTSTAGNRGFKSSSFKNDSLLTIR
jgi:hypothetical protein